MIKTPLLLLVMLIAAYAGEMQQPSPAATAKKSSVKRQFSFVEPWNSTFHQRTTETGEILTIGAVFSDGNIVYVYDEAVGAVVLLDSLGTPVHTIPLTTIGRNSYMGDDFVVKDASFIFLNSIDRKLLFFDKTSGSLQKSIALPADLLGDAKKRSWRTLSRLFLDEGTLFIGNEFYLVPFDYTLGKRVAKQATVSVAGNERFVLYKKKSQIVARDSQIERRPGKATFRCPSTFYPVAGKRLFTAKDRLFAVEAGKDSIRIVEVK